MTPLLTLFLCLLMVATSFLSGVFGMAGGMILIGVLLLVMPVPTAMVLHAVTQIASNAWRGLIWRRHVRWATVAAHVVGYVLAVFVWPLTLYVPSKPVALISLGVAPFLIRLIPGDWKPDPERFGQGIVYGSACMTLMLLTGVSGPLLDTYFLGLKLDRREIIATKAMCQIISHGIKLVYFGGIIAEAGSLDPTLAALAILASMIGTTLAKRFLEAMTEAQYRRWSGWLINGICGYYLIHGAALLQMPQL